MKKTILLLAVLALLAAAVTLTAGEKPRIGVLRFTNSTNAYWWSGGTARDLQDMLVSELASKKVFRVLERKELGAVLSEQDLGASGRVNPATAAKLGRIAGAKYLVAATVSAFEKNVKGGKGGLSFRGIHVGGKKKRAYIAVDLKVVDTTTGEIVDSRTVEATSKSTGINLGLYRGGFGGNLAKEKKTPVGKAIRACIIEIADYLECSLIHGQNAPCMDDYKAKENRRREKTKKSIDLE